MHFLLLYRLASESCYIVPKQIVLGNVEGALRRGWDRNEKEWIDCVQSHARAFGHRGGLQSDGVEGRDPCGSLRGGGGLWPR